MPPDSSASASEETLTTKPLCDVAEINPESLSASTPADYRFKYVDLGAADRGHVRWEQVSEVRFATAPTRARRVVKPGDVLFGTVRPSLQSHAAVPSQVPDGAIVASTGFSVIRARQNAADSRFLFQFIMTDELRRQAERLAVGSNYPAVNESDVRRFQVPDLSVPEQRVIAVILDTADDAIRQTERLVAKLRRVKQGLFQDLLTLGLNDDGELRRSGRDANEFRESRLGRLPRQWDVRRVDGVSELVTSGSRGWGSYYSESGALFVRIGNLTRDHINLRLDSVVHVKPPRSESKRTRLEHGDVLMSITADLGIVGVVPKGLGEAYVNQHIALVRVDPAKANCRWVAHYLSGSQVQMLVRRLDDPGAKAGLNLPTVSGFPLALPPRHEQDEIVARLDSADAAIATEERYLRKLVLIKAGLQEDLISTRMTLGPDAKGATS